MKIRHKIMCWVAGAGLFTSLVFSLVIFLDMRGQPLDMMDAQLKSTADDVAGQLVGGNILSGGEQPKGLYISPDRYWVKAYDRDLRVVYQSNLSGFVDLPLYRNKGEAAYTITVHVPRTRIDLHQDKESNVAFRARELTENVKGIPYLIQVAKPMEGLEEETSELVAAIGIGLAVSTFLLIGLSYVLAGQIVKPIAVINTLARDINENTLEKRIPLGKSRDEIHELATCLNRMFDRLQFSFVRQKQYLADASHELKSPIAMLRLFFEEAIQHRDLPETFRHQLDTQGHNVLRMDRLVRTMLELSILEIKASLTLERFNLADLARSVAGDFAPLAEEAKIRLETHIPSQADTWGDKDKIRRALINVFDNSIKYNDEKGLIRFTVAEKDGCNRLSLYNTGPGIPNEDLPKVFDQFYRVDKSRSTKYGGAGLGLAIVREIVRLHMGTITIDSRQGLWTQVDIHLPRIPDGKHAS